MEPFNGRIPQRERQSHLPVALGLVSPDKEKVIVGSACKDVEFAEEAARILEANEFWDERNRYMFMAVSFVATETHEPLDSDMITRTANTFAKRDGQPFQFMRSEIEALPCDVPMARGHISAIKRHAVHRQLSNLIEWGTGQLALSTDEVNLYHEFSERFENIKPRKMTSAVTLGNELLDIITQKMEMRLQLAKQGRVLAPEYPWDSWNGKLKPPAYGKIHIFGAPDGGGKSSTARAIAKHWAEMGFNVAFVHNEDSRNEIEDKLVCTEAMVDLDVIENPDKATAEQMYEIQEAHKRMATWLPNLHMVDGTEMSSIDALNELIAMRKKGKCDIVLLDYMGAFKTTRGQGNMQEWQKVVDDCSRFVTFSSKYKTPVTTMAQGTKEMLEPGAILTRRHLMGGAQFYHKAQTVVLSTRTTLTDPFTDSFQNVIAEIGDSSPTMVSAIDKQNSGPKGRMTQYFDGRYFRITDKPWWM